MVRDTPPSQDASTHQIWNSYLKEYRRYGPDTKAGRTDTGTDWRTVRLLYASQSSFGGIKSRDSRAFSWKSREKWEQIKKVRKNRKSKTHLKAWFHYSRTRVNHVLLYPDIFFLETTVDPYQLASNEAIWSGSTLFSNLIDKPCLQLKCYRLTG